MVVAAIVVLVLALVGAWVTTRTPRARYDCVYCGAKRLVIHNEETGQAYCFHCRRLDYIIRR